MSGEGPAPAGRVVILHVMKTAGTSLRRVLQDRLGPGGVYPSDEDLAALPEHEYLGPRDLLEADQQGRTGPARVLIGHLPYVVVDGFTSRPVTAAVLRDPLARTISMMEHRRRSGALAEATYEELLDHDEFVANQIRDYQTKVFAFDSVDECPDGVNVPLEIDDGRFGRALRRLDSVDILGLTEDLDSFLSRLGEAVGLDEVAARRDNPGRYQPPELGPQVRERILALTERDRELYARARGRVGRRGWRSRLLRTSRRVGSRGRSRS